MHACALLGPRSFLQFGNRLLYRGMHVLSVTSMKGGSVSGSHLMDKANWYSLFGLLSRHAAHIMQVTRLLCLL